MVEGKKVQLRISEIILEMIKVDETPGRLTESTRLKEDLQLDSLAFVQLHMAMEDTFGIRINPDRTDVGEAFSTIGSLTGMVLDYLEPYQAG